MDWTAVIVAFIAAVPATLVAVAGLRRSGRAESAAGRAEGAATQAAANSAPVSNGFAKGVRDDLAAILEVATAGRDAATRAEALAETAVQKAERAGDLIADHLAAHANSPHVVPLRAAKGGRA